VGDVEPWLSRARDTLRRSDSGLVTERGRTPWRDLLAAAERVAADLPPSRHGWVVPADGAERSVVGLLAVGLARPAPRWVLGDPTRWAASAPVPAPSTVDTGASSVPGPAGAGPGSHSVPGSAEGSYLVPAGSAAAPPAGVDGPTYATATSGTTGAPKLLFGRPDSLVDAVRLYAHGMPEYAAAEVFAACSSIDFAAGFYMVVAPAIVLGRDLVLFRPSRWDLAADELAGRPGVCLAAASLAAAGARTVRPGRRYRDTRFVPAGGGLTANRAERITAGFAGCGFLTMLGSTETGLLTVDREVRQDGHVGWPLPGKPVWLNDIGPDGVGTLWTRGPDTRFAATGGELLTGPAGAVSTGDLAHRHPDGGFVLDGRADQLVKVDGVSVYPRQIVGAVRAIPGVVDASVSVDRSAAVDRITVVAVGEVTEEQVRQACAELPTPLVPHRVRRRPADGSAVSDRGKVLL